MLDSPIRRDAIVFFARDFLSVEFPQLRVHFDDLARVYVVVSDTEARSVREIDPEGDVVQLGAVIGDPGPLDHEAIAVNMDRFLRYLDQEEIVSVLRSVAGVCEYVLARYLVRFYMDEPVSGYTNAAFNRAFGGAGAVCLHFQTAWLPGFGFFVSDVAQDAPVRLDVLTGGSALAREHLRQRQSGLARPLYVLGYGKYSKRLIDIATTTAKIIYRKLFRRKALYIDRDTSAHRIHVRCLIHSLLGRYSSDPVHRPDGKYVIFPLHYEPESLLNYFSPFSRQEEIASQVLDTLPADYTLVLKEHPSQPGALHLPKWAELRSAARVAILPGNYPASNLLALKPVVVSIGSTFALEAAVAGCRVGMLGRTHFQHVPGITYLERPSDWLSLMDAPVGSGEDIVRWYGDFLDQYCFRGVFMRDNTMLPDFASVAAALGMAATENPRPKKSGSTAR